MRPSLVILALALTGCDPGGNPRLETEADSLAFRITEGAGGLRVWEALPALAFEWAVVRDSIEVTRRHHLWDKKNDRYRIEWPLGDDSVAVAVFAPSAFDVASPSGRVAINGVELSGAQRAERLEEAHGRFVNDSYWLLAPLKTLDPGVRREVDRESGFPMLALSFDGVGLTPGDRYWLEVDDVTGTMTGWSYLLEGDTARTRWEWIDPIELGTPDGALRLPRMKVVEGSRSVILTEPSLPDDLDPSVFETLTPLRARS
jgi:hypothetical protein